LHQFAEMSLSCQCSMHCSISKVSIASKVAYFSEKGNLLIIILLV
jgi:hypothetical protein